MVDEVLRGVDVEVFLEVGEVPREDGRVDPRIEAEARGVVSDAVVLRDDVKVLVGLYSRQADIDLVAVLAAELVLGVAEGHDQLDSVRIRRELRVSLPFPQPVVHARSADRVAHEDELAWRGVDRGLNLRRGEFPGHRAPAERPAGVLLAERSAEGGLRFTALPGGAFCEQRSRRAGGGDNGY